MSVPRIEIHRFEDQREESNGLYGWIEPEDKSWVLFLGKTGRPAYYYPQGRDETGEPVGTGITVIESEPYIKA
jgi:hypothetical protein